MKEDQGNMAAIKFAVGSGTRGKDTMFLTDEL